LVPGRLIAARGYLGGEDFMGYENNITYFAKKCARDILLRNHDAVWSDFNCVIGKWWGEENYWTWCGG
jgi:hypothetical protein